MREAHRRADVQVEVALLVGETVRGEVEVEAEPGVVDEHLNGPLRIGETGCHGVEPRVVGEVGHEHLDLDAARDAQGAGEPTERRFVARDQHQVGAAGGELPRELRSEARARSGDECRLRHAARGPTRAEPHTWTPRAERA